MSGKKKGKPKKDQDQKPPPLGGEADVSAFDVEPEATCSPQQALQTERDELIARLQRVTADYQNSQKRMQRDLAQAREYANEDLMKAFLGVLDDMERALEAGRAGRLADDPLVTGMQLVHDNALTTLDRFGLTRIEAVGKPFDPQWHTALMRHPTGDHPPQTVVTEVQKGYRFKGRTLRPSGVVVATDLEEEQTPDPADGPGDIEQ
jgi:molecular chaperone GrpE